ncbi:DUF3558 family protein [Streptomyces catenulae]|uniref:DUF3558 family protein n=1 Tax=Streptomyces catenulae TaxID=66875 RepID=A0ABV2Z0E6_9ACTN|nr:DUF3558 family protein [Streptomyces catenulae]
MHRSSKRLASILACAAVPVMLVAGCSDSGSKDAADASDPSAPASSAAKPSPSLAPAKYAKLPDPCTVFANGTLKQLLPKPKSSAGEKGKSSDPNAGATCSWYSSKSEGVDGSQFRWLDVSFKRYDSEAAVNATGEKRAEDFYAKQVDLAKATKDATKVKSGAVDGVGSAATWVTYNLKSKGNDYRNQTVVVRADNIVVTLNYNGAGLAGGDTPDSSDLLKDAEKAVKEAVEAATGKSAAPDASQSASGKATDGAKKDDTSDSKSDAKDGKDSKDAKDAKS